MKKKFSAFTLAEIFIVLVVIGVIAALTIPNLGSKVDRNKGLFKKNYGVVEKIIAELVNDEKYYPYDERKGYFGFGQNSNVEIMGAEECTGKNRSNNTNTPPCDGKVKRLEKFCKLFSNQMNLKKTNDTGCEFTTSDGVEWKISQPSNETDGFLKKIIDDEINGFIIKFDVNGDKGPNKPEDIEKVANQGDTKDRDTFYILVRHDGKMQLPSKDETAKEYLSSSDLNQKK